MKFRDKISPSALSAIVANGVGHVMAPWRAVDQF